MLQLITHQFCHGNLAHLSSNLFQLCVFGRFVEETEGFWGVIGIYFITGVGKFSELLSIIGVLT
jgi:membrane associated rhomboid family serine protease